MREMEKRLGVVWITEILIACGFTGQLDSKMIEITKMVDVCYHSV